MPCSQLLTGLDRYTQVSTGPAPAVFCTSQGAGQDGEWQPGLSKQWQPHHTGTPGALFSFGSVLLSEASLWKMSEETPSYFLRHWGSQSPLLSQGHKPLLHRMRQDWSVMSTFFFSFSFNKESKRKEDRRQIPLTICSEAGIFCNVLWGSF